MEQHFSKRRRTSKGKTMEQNSLKKSKTLDNLWKNLPNDILDRILYSNLGFPRNSVITIYDTTFDIKLCDQTRYSYYDMYNYWKSLNNLFMIFTSPSITTFHLHLTFAFCRYDKSCSIINSWTRRLRRKNVQHFKITLQSDASFRSDDLLLDLLLVFRLQSLITLDLNLCVYGTVSSVDRRYINLPNLQKLNLTLVDNYEVLEWLLISCPTLEDFSLIVKGVHSQEYRHKKQKYLSEVESISVLSKSLKRLCIGLEKGSGDIEFKIDAPNLVHFDFGVRFWSKSSEIYTPMFDSISHVKSLVLDIKMWTSIDNKTIIFPNVTHLTWVASFPHEYQDLALMLHSFPSLEVLVLKQNNGGCYWESSVKEDITIPLDRVKRIELLTDNAHLAHLNLATRLLRSAPLLEELILRAKDSYGFVKAIDVRTLLKSPRLSPHCEIEFLGGYESWLKSLIVHL